MLHEGDVNMMQHVITHGLYTYLVSRFGAMPDNHHRQHSRCVNLSASKQNAIREVTAHKRQAKKGLRQLRKSGSSPEEVRPLAQKFHLLVCQHSKIVKEARQLTAKASAKQMRKECHRDIHKFARKILDEDNYTSIQPSFGQEQAEEYFSRVYSTTPKTFSHPEWMPECPQPYLINESMLAPLKTVALNKVKLKCIPNPPSRADINNANDVQQLFDLLHIDSNWVDIALLDQIVKVSRSENAASILSEYKESHKSVIADALARLVDPSTDGTCPRPDANSGILQLVFSDEREGMRVQEVLTCKQFLCDRFSVQPESIKFISAVIGNSLVVTWLVSRHTGWRVVNQCKSPPVLAALQEIEVIAVRFRYPGKLIEVEVDVSADI